MIRQHPFEAFRIFRRARIVPILQVENADCGYACLAMMASYFGARTDLSGAKAFLGGSGAALNVKSLLEASLAMGLNARAVRVGLQSMKRVSRPFIAHWNLTHFVVVEKIGKREAVIVDPAVGRMRVSAEEFNRAFTGVAIEYNPVQKLSLIAKTPRIRLRDILRVLHGAIRGMITIFVLFGVLNLFGLLSPMLFQFVIDTAIEQRNVDLVVTIFSALFVVSLAFVALEIATGIYILNFHTRLAFQFFQRMFLHLLMLPSSYFRNRSVGDINTRLASYDQVQEVITVEAISEAMSVVFGILALGIVLMYDWRLFVLTLIIFGIKMILTLIFFGINRRLQMKTAIIDARLESKQIEVIRGHQSIKTLGIEHRAFNEVTSLEADSINTQFELERAGIYFSVPQKIIGLVETIAVPGIALILVANDSLTIGMFFAVQAYMRQFTAAGDQFTAAVLSFAEIRVHLERFSDILKQKPELPVGTIMTPGSEDADEEDEHPGGVLDETALEFESLELEGVSFRYAPNLPDVVTDLSLRVEKGQKICVLGESGSGKTTILRLLSGLEEPTEGTLLINDATAYAVEVRRLRRAMGTVVQEDQLFSESVKNNITISADTIEDAEVERVMRIADIYQEMNAMPMGLNTLLGDMGSMISTGQRQRLILARALYGAPQLLVMDEGTAHLDPERKHLIMQRISDLDITLIFATHDAELAQYSDVVWSFGEDGLTITKPKDLTT